MARETSLSEPAFICASYEEADPVMEGLMTACILTPATRNILSILFTVFFRDLQPFASK